MRLPYFPLHVVVFPHLPLPIHVFEERYRLMTHDVLADGSPFAGRFVVSMITEGSDVEEPGAAPPTAERIGTIVEVRSAERFDDGRYALLVVGLARAALAAVDQSGPYATVDASPLPEEAGDAAGATRLLPAVQAALDAYLETVKRFVASAASWERNRRRSPPWLPHWTRCSSRSACRMTRWPPVTRSAGCCRSS
jgi:Lon protease-like protein